MNYTRSRLWIHEQRSAYNNLVRNFREGVQFGGFAGRKCKKFNIGSDLVNLYLYAPHIFQCSIARPTYRDYSRNSSIL
jgi:hypothetical protein